MNVLSRLFTRSGIRHHAVAESGHRIADDGLTVSPMRRADIAEVLEIERTAYPQPWTEGVFRDELAMQARGTRHYLVARLAGRLVGYGGMIYMDTAAHITNIAVDAAMRRRGIATEIMLDLAWEARRAGMESLTLEVRESNMSAQALYRRFGFAPVGVRAKYYENRDDAIVMWCTDIQSSAFAQRLRTIDAERSEAS
jgi:ribosomal-protein-alanine N-acetyltransferase